MPEVALRILGCGASTGVPVIGCECAVCRSTDARNHRTRASVMFEVGEKRILVDTSPDLRQQALREGISQVDAILFTHDHADHTHGIDEVKAFNHYRQAVIPAYGDAVTLASLKQRFSYVFQPPIPAYGWFRPALEAYEIGADGLVDVAGVPVRVFPQRHGRHLSLGFRVGNIAYSTDCNQLDEAAFEALKGTEIWVVDCLRLEAAPTHAHMALTLEWVQRVKPRLAVLTHMSHHCDYQALIDQLPDGVVPGIDGMRLPEMLS